MSINAIMIIPFKFTAQVKVREMKAEIARLNEQAEAGERERSAKKHYEKRVKELAQELTGKSYK